MLPLLSIIIPVYNGEAFVADAIESALAQTYANKEVVVIDDGSTDGTVGVLQRYEGRIRYESGPNRGGCTARNRGVELARGELVQFLDADDLLHPDKLERQVPEVLARKADVVCSAWEVRTFEGELLKGPLEIVRHTDSVISMIRGGLVVEAPLHWKANLQRVGGFDESLPCSQERDLHLRLACEGLAFTAIPDVLVTVRRRAESVSADGRKILRLRGRLGARVQRLLEANGALTDERRFALARMLANEARALIGAGETEAGKALLEQARRLDGKGVDSSYDGLARWLCSLTGPVVTERVIALKRKLVGRRMSTHA